MAIDPITGKDIKISMLCPMKSRKYAKPNSIESLLSTADNPEQIEILIRLDWVDWGHIWKLPQDNVRLVVGERGEGSRRLERYHDEILRIANGDMCMVWCDDAEMITKGWDTILLDKYNENEVMFPMSRQSLPVFPRSMWEKIKPLKCSIDAYFLYLSALGHCGVKVPEIEFEISHDDNADEDRRRINKEITEECSSKELMDIIYLDARKLNG